VKCYVYCSRTPRMIMDAAGSSWRGNTAKPEQGVLISSGIKKTFLPRETPTEFKTWSCFFFVAVPEKPEDGGQVDGQLPEYGGRMDGQLRHSGILLLFTRPGDGRMDGQQMIWCYVAVYKTRGRADWKQSRANKILKNEWNPVHFSSISIKYFVSIKKM